MLTAWVNRAYGGILRIVVLATQLLQAITPRGTTNDTEENTRAPYGRARWGDAAPSGAPGRKLTNGPFIGLWASGSGRNVKYEPIHYEGDGHLLLVAPSRAGKARDLLMWSLLTNRDSAVVIDKSGELAAQTARARRAMGHSVYVLNPFGLHTGPPYFLPQHGFNPLKVLDVGGPNFTNQIESLAAALVPHDPKGESHWSDTARILQSGTEIHEVLTTVPYGKTPSLGKTRDYMTLSDGDFETCMRSLCEHPSWLVRDRLQGFCELTNEMRSVRSSARTATKWLGDDAMRKVVEQHDFDFADLKRKPMTVYFVLPSHLIAEGTTYARWLRVMIQSALQAMTTTPRVHKRPVWLVIDETFSLGHMGLIERMLSEGAGFGIQLQIVVQGLSQLKSIYGENWETFVGNSAVKQFFAAADMTTASYVSKLLGQYTANTQNISAKNEVSIGETGRPLLRPEEVMQLPDHAQVVFLRGCPNPLLLYRSPYYKPKWGFCGQYDPNPFHVE